MGLVGDEWQQRVVEQLNSALDRWIEAIPPHRKWPSAPLWTDQTLSNNLLVRWSKDISDQIFLNQAATLNACYYLTIMLIYRPFIDHPVTYAQPDAPTSMSEIKKLPYPAFSICTNAAHAAIKTLDEVEQASMDGYWNTHGCVAITQTAAGVQLMRLWDPNLQGKRGSRMDKKYVRLVKREDGDNKWTIHEGLSEREMLLEDLEIAQRLLDTAADRWIMARRFVSVFSLSISSSSYLCCPFSDNRFRSRIRDSLPGPGESEDGDILMKTTPFAMPARRETAPAPAHGVPPYSSSNHGNSSWAQ